MSIVLEQLTKRYAGHPVVNRVSLEIADGEFFVLIGPSGSGKSTILRMIAGLNTADEGRIVLQGRDVTGATPQQREVGFVFQNYALFQHMSVADNVEFALRVRKVPAPQRRERRNELLELVGLAGLGNRLPSQLSGGQQQRVALARALAHRPSVLLLDEPFGALDAKIRVDLRRALRQIQTELGITAIFVTHDQEEAFELADRLGVMNFGRLLEVGTPHELYQRPQTEFVATFLGTANLLVGEANTEGVQVGPVFFPLNTEAGQWHKPTTRQRVQVLFRPEDVALARLDEPLASPQLGQGTVEQSVFSGSFERLRLRLPPILGVRPIAPPVPFGEDAVFVEVTRTQDVARRLPLALGEKVKVGVRRMHALVHPGLRFLLLSDGLEAATAALVVGGSLARLAHARVMLLGYGGVAEALPGYLQSAKEKLGSGLAQLEVQATPNPLETAVARAVEQQPYDLVICGVGQKPPMQRVAITQSLLRSGEHHVLLVPANPPEIMHALVCVTGGEPGKEDVLFAGRLLRHLGAKATLLSVVRLAENKGEPRDRAQRFLADGVRSLEVLGVPAQSVLRVGQPLVEIVQEMKGGGYNLLVLGAPLPQRESATSVAGVVGQLLAEMTAHPVLIVRSRYISMDSRLQNLARRVNIAEKVVQ